MKAKQMVFAAAVLVVAGLLAAPASAQAVKEKSCQHVSGSNSMDYDCGFRIKDYVVGTPVTFKIDYACTGSCGPVLSFGLGESGFAPEGVAGHMVGGRRLPTGLELTFVFDSLRKTGNHAMGSAHFVMNVMMDDGAGNRQAMPCPVDVHLKTPVK